MTWKDEVLRIMPRGQEITIPEIIAIMRPGLIGCDYRVAVNRTHTVLTHEIKWGTVEKVGYKKDSKNLRVAIWRKN